MTRKSVCVCVCVTIYNSVIILVGYSKICLFSVFLVTNSETRCGRVQIRESNGFHGSKEL